MCECAEVDGDKQGTWQTDLRDLPLVLVAHEEGEAHEQDAGK
jgi:hypothetical protein